MTPATDGFGASVSDRQNVPLAHLEVVWHEVLAPKLVARFVEDLSFPPLTAAHLQGRTREACVNMLVDIAMERAATARRYVKATVRKGIPLPPRIPTQLDLPL